MRLCNGRKRESDCEVDSDNCNCDMTSEWATDSVLWEHKYRYWCVSIDHRAIA